MADSTLTRTTPIINSLPDFSSDVYAAIAPAELVVFAIFTLKSDGAYSATEEIVSACFRLFPHRFSLKNYFYWPDSATTLSFLNEAKNKGDLKGNQTEGFAVKVQGRQTVKRVAKLLGVTLPAPEKKIKPAPKPEIEKKAEVQEELKPVQPALNEIPAKKKTVAPQKKKLVRKPLIKQQPVKKAEEKKSAKPVTKKAPEKKRVVLSEKKKPVVSTAKKKAVVAPSMRPVVRTPAPAKKKPAKQTAPVKTKAMPKPAPVKQATLLQVKLEEPKKKKEQAKPVAPKKETPQKQPAQLTMLPLVEEKKEKPAPPVVKKVEPKPVKVEMVIVPTAVAQVSKEEKVKAGKVVQVMERSDAYRQYKKAGDKSKISEFDFRSLLLCTMESTPETLARNVNTFKGYANIQNRQDLVVFLNFVEGSFSGLLNSSGKKLAKKK